MPRTLEYLGYRHSTFIICHPNNYTGSSKIKMIKAFLKAPHMLALLQKLTCTNLLFADFRKKCQGRSIVFQNQNRARVKHFRWRPLSVSRFPHSGEVFRYAYFFYTKKGLSYFSISSYL